MHPPMAAIASASGGLYSADSGILRPMALCDSDNTDNLRFAPGHAGAVFGGLVFGYTLFGVELLLLVLLLAELASTKILVVGNLCLNKLERCH